MNMTRNNQQKERTMNDTRRISDKDLKKMIESAQRLLSRRNPVVEETWWENLLAALTELQARRNNEGATQ